MDFLHHEDLDTKEIHEMEMYFFEENRQKSRHLWILLFSMLPVRNIHCATLQILSTFILFGGEIWTNSKICYTNADTKKNEFRKLHLIINCSNCVSF